VRERERESEYVATVLIHVIISQAQADCRRDRSRCIHPRDQL
jgi:hypothetical protein